MACGSTRAGIDVMFATIIVNLTNVGPMPLFEIAITLFGIWHNKMFDFNPHQLDTSLVEVRLLKLG